MVLVASTRSWEYPVSSSEGCKGDCAEAQILRLKLWRNSVPKFSLPIFPSDYLEHLCDLEIGYITQEIGNSETSNIKEKSKCPGEKSATGMREASVDVNTGFVWAGLDSLYSALSTVP